MNDRCLCSWSRISLRVLWKIPFVIGVWFLACIIGSRAQEPVSGSADSDDCSTPFFAFGDDILDTGNAVLIPGAPKSASKEPYGSTLGLPSGRFSDGRLVIDHLAQLLQCPSPRPFASLQNTSSSDLHSGISFAVAGSGVLSSSAPFSSLATQVKQFQELLKNRSLTVATNRFSNGIAVISVGAADYMKPSPAARPTSDSGPAHGTLLLKRVIDGISDAMRTLRSFGLRHFVLLGLAPHGCSPAWRPRELASPYKDDATPSPLACNEDLNALLQDHNRRVKLLVRRMHADGGDVRAMFVDVFEYFHFLTVDPESAGMEELSVPCCGMRLANGQWEECGHSRVSGSSAMAPSSHCSNPSRFVFWDSFHTTDEFNRGLALEAAHGLNGFTFPPGEGVVPMVGATPLANAVTSRRGGSPKVQGWAKAPIYALALVVGGGFMVLLVIYMQLPKQQMVQPRLFRLNS